MTPDQARSLAAGAAQQAASALAALTRYVHEGPDYPDPFGQEEVVDLLLDAAKMAMEIEAAGETVQPERADVYAPIVAHLEGWCG